MLDKRIIQNGRSVDFTCSNRLFETDINKGKPHGVGQGGVAHALGSVFDAPLVSHGGYTLWLEHAINRKDQSEKYWLMWYDPNGIPTIPLSSVMDRADIQEMSRQLSSFVP